MRIILESESAQKITDRKETAYTDRNFLLREDKVHRE
jgi:hypothetical protein